MSFQVLKKKEKITFFLFFYFVVTRYRLHALKLCFVLWTLSAKNTGNNGFWESYLGASCSIMCCKHLKQRSWDCQRRVARRRSEEVCWHWRGVSWAKANWLSQQLHPVVSKRINSNYGSLFIFPTQNVRV